MNVPSLLGDRLNELFGEENHPLVLLETSLGIHWVTLGFSTSINQAISQPPRSHPVMLEEWNRLVLEESINALENEDEGDSDCFVASKWYMVGGSTGKNRIPR